MSVIDARWLFAAKRGFTAHMLKLGLLQRACPQGGTVVPWPRQMRDRSFVASLPDFTDWPASDEDWSWLDELTDKEPA